MPKQAVSAPPASSSDCSEPSRHSRPPVGALAGNMALACRRRWLSACRDLPGWLWLRGAHLLRDRGIRCLPWCP